MTKEKVKLSKGAKLHFVSREEDEEIIKSSNNREEGIIKTFSVRSNRFKEYTVNRVLEWIENGTVILKPKADQ